MIVILLSFQHLTAKGLVSVFLGYCERWVQFTALLQRKRKRRNSDAVNVCSLDISLPHEQDNKRKRGLSKVVSLANLLSTPMRPVRKIGASFQVCHDI